MNIKKTALAISASALMSGSVFAACSADIDMASNKITNLVMTDASGTSSEAANKNYVDSKVSRQGTIEYLETGGATNSSWSQNVATPVDITTTASNVCLGANSGGGGFAVISGMTNANRFFDVVAWGRDNGTQVVIQSVATRGTPDARTYSVTGIGQLQLSVASGSYKVSCLSFTSPYTL
jgi:hypothetical protein